RSRPSRTSGPSTKRTVARAVYALQDNLQHFQTISALGEADPDRGLEPPFHEVVEPPDDAVELGGIEVLEQHATDEVDVAVGAEREVRAVGLMVARQQEPVQLELVGRRIGH